MCSIVFLSLQKCHRHDSLDEAQESPPLASRSPIAQFAIFGSSGLDFKLKIKLFSPTLTNIHFHLKTTIHKNTIYTYTNIEHPIPRPYAYTVQSHSHNLLLSIEFIDCLTFWILSFWLFSCGTPNPLPQRKC